MGWIKFDYDCGRAQVWYETATEDGWVFDFDDTDKTFRIWSNGESKAMGDDPDYICQNLNEVCERVRTFT